MPLTWPGSAIQGLTSADVVLVLGMLLVIRLSSQIGVWAYALLALPGTLAHELAHYLVAAFHSNCLSRADNSIETAMDEARRGPFFQRG